MLYGRDAERTLVGALLDAARASRSGALVLRGEPGVGKTALLEDVRDRAADMHVLAARGVESESELPFAGLHQLLRPALHLLERLPAPQSDALQGALGLAARAGDRFLISAACLTLVAELAERRPVLCLIDDAQWLDTPSADALLFVARRLDAEGVVMLFGAREGGDRRFEAGGLRELELGRLDADAAEALIGLGAGGPVAPSVRDVLLEQAGGNALALVELPAALSAAQLAGAEPLPAALPLTRVAERLFLERVRGLPEPTQRLLSVIATDDGGRLAPVMQAAASLGVGAEALTPAEQIGLVSVHGARIELRHPLVRSAVYQSTSSAERRAAHLALAGALAGEPESDQRAWHLAAATLGADAGVADELERTAERARLRSGHAAAAAALDRAAELSVDAESRARRLVGAAKSAWQAGLPERAKALLAHADPIVTDPRLRAELTHVDGVIEFRCGIPLDASVTLIAGAADVAPVDTRKALEMLFDGALAGVDAGDYARVAEAGRIAASLPRSADEQGGFLADLLVSVGSLVEGKTAQEAPLVLDVLARARDVDEPRWLIWAAAGAGTAGDEAAEAAILKRATALARTSGAVDALMMVLLTIGVNGVTAGRPGVAAEATEGLALAGEAGLPNAVSIHRAVLAWVAAVKGEDERCRAYAADVAASARPAGAALAGSIAEWGLALLDLGAGRLDETVARLSALREAPPGLIHPLFVLLSAADLVEACVRSGRDEAAAGAFAVLEGFARPGAPAWALALAARCRALLGRDAEAAFAEALRLHTRRFDLARTQLLFGELLRRQRRRVDARAHLRAALENFEALGAAPWTERARGELRATGETARKRDASTLGQLTPQELQVARLVGDGLSNKEVAAQLFLSPRTIDAHLRNVFAKLGITSRTQLARLELSSDSPSQTALPTLA